MNSQQLAAVECAASRLLILAGAGTGKTRVLTARVARVLRENSRQRALAVTFTNRATREMEERLHSLCPAAMPRVMVRTFHAFGAWLLRRYSGYLNLHPRFVIYDTSDSLVLLRSLKDEKRNLKHYLSQIQRAKEEGIVGERQLAEFCDDPDFPRYYSVYQENLRASGNVDFSDLVCLPLRLLEQHPEVCAQLRQHFDQIFVDEFQDSSSAQLRLLQLLMGPANKLTVVGDEDQSIYKFRGAVVANIVSFQQHFPGAEVLRLELNYRSSAPILQLANAVIRANTFRLGKELIPVDTREAERPTLRVFADQAAEAAFAATWFLQQPDLQLAVLYRNNAQAYAFEQCFRAQGLAYRLLGGMSFFSFEEIKTLLSYVMFFLNPRDAVAFARMVSKPARGLGSVALRQIQQYGQGDLLLGLQRSPLKGKAAEGRDALLALGEQVQQWLSCCSLAEVFAALAQESGLKAYYQQVDQKEESERCLHLLQLQQMAGEYGQGVDALVSFLEMAGLTSGERPESQQAKLVLATLHSTKGLEYDRVLLSGLEEGIFPSRLSFNSEDLEEERRLFYVGITRAKKQLCLSRCESRCQYGHSENYGPSSFLQGLGEALLSSPQRRSTQVTDCTEFNGRRVKHRDYGPGQVIAAKYHPPEVDCSQLCGRRVQHCDYGAGKVIAAKYYRESLVLILQLDDGTQVSILPELQTGKLLWLKE